MNQALLRHWTLDPEVTFLNHGSYGAVLGVVQDHQNEFRRRMEQQPVDFMEKQLRPALDKARSVLSSFLGAHPNDLVFVNNATEGVNSVLQSFPWEVGDRVLVTDHGYQACRNAVDFVAEKFGLIVDVAEIPFPLASSDLAVDQVLGMITLRTRLALLDHVTSPTALVLPVERMIPDLRSAGVRILIDGAHAPGMLPLNINHVGADYYTGNCHKWMCAPKGAGFLWVREDCQHEVRPVSISHGASEGNPNPSRFVEEFSWKGTDDFSPWLCVPAAIEALGSLVDGGWPDVMQANRKLALEARDILCASFSIAPPAPDVMIGSMASIPLPPGDAEIFHNNLLSLGIEAPVFAWNGSRLLRASAQLYNKRDDYEHLAKSAVVVKESLT